MPLKCTGELPAVFTQNVQQVTKNELDVLNQSEERDKSIRSGYLVAANYQIERIIRSGNALHNDEISKYLREITNVVLKDNPAAAAGLNIYTLRSPVVNAYSFDKGYIFVDIGMVAMAETEAQLAYLLCHEITHFTNKHNLNGYVRETKIDRKRFDGKSYEDKLIEKCQYSKELESEADVEGFKLFKKSNYDLKQALKLFDVLQYSYLPFELVEFKKSFFERENFVIPDKYVIKEVQPISDNSNEDDRKQTHPNTAKRKKEIADMIDREDNSGRQNSVIGQEKFEYIRDLARMELCRLYIAHRDYPNALYAAYILLQKYPENQFLHEIVCKSLLAISLYQRGLIKYSTDSYLEDGIPATRKVEGLPQGFYYFINNMPVNEWTIMSLNYVYRMHSRYPQNKVISECSGSLIKLMAKTDWGISDFDRGLNKPESNNPKDSVKSAQKVITKTDLINLEKEKERVKEMEKQKEEQRNRMKKDTAYYKAIYVDLFLNDTAFSRNFPKAVPLNLEEINSSFRPTFSDWNEENIILNHVKIDTVIMEEPFYLKYNLTKYEKFRYVASDNLNEKFKNVVDRAARNQGLETQKLDPSLMDINDVDKLNDFAAITEWVQEKEDSNQEGVNIFCNNDVKSVIKKYGTQYLLKVGIVSVNFLHWTNTYFYGCVYDLKNNKTVYKRYEMIPERDSNTLLNAKTYQMIYDLKHPKPYESKNSSFFFFDVFSFSY